MKWPAGWPDGLNGGLSGEQCIWIHNQFQEKRKNNKNDDVFLHKIFQRIFYLIYICTHVPLLFDARKYLDIRQQGPFLSKKRILPRMRQNFSVFFTQNWLRKRRRKKKMTMIKKSVVRFVFGGKNRGAYIFCMIDQIKRKNEILHDTICVFYWLRSESMPSLLTVVVVVLGV